RGSGREEHTSAPPSLKYFALTGVTSYGKTPKRPQAILLTYTFNKHPEARVNIRVNYKHHYNTCGSGRSAADQKFSGRIFCVIIKRAAHYRYRGGIHYTSCCQRSIHVSSDCCRTKNRSKAPRKYVGTTHSSACQLF